MVNKYFHTRKYIFQTEVSITGVKSETSPNKKIGARVSFRPLPQFWAKDEKSPKCTDFHAKIHKYSGSIDSTLGTVQLPLISPFRAIALRYRSASLVSAPHRSPTKFGLTLLIST